MYSNVQKNLYKYVQTDIYLAIALEKLKQIKKRAKIHFEI